MKFFKTRKSKKGRTITKYIGTGSVVEIPKELDGLAVIEIASQAFYFRERYRDYHLHPLVVLRCPHVFSLV